MSESSSVKMSVLISSPTSMITSRGGSDSDCDIFKNFMKVSTGEQTMIQKPKSKGCVQDLHKKFSTRRNTGTKSNGALSPFAKIFVPSFEKLALRESSFFAGEIAHKLPYHNSGKTLIGKVYE